MFMLKNGVPTKFATANIALFFQIAIILTYHFLIISIIAYD